MKNKYCDDLEFAKLQIELQIFKEKNSRILGKALIALNNKIKKDGK